MNREQMVERVARAISANEGRVATVRDQGDARAVLDAILPQVTTVAELEALPIGSLLVSQGGGAYRPSAPGFVVSDAYGLVHLDDVIPLTVVWQPGEVTA